VTARWAESPVHRHWLREHALAQLRHYAAALNPTAGFYDLDDDGVPLPTGWPPAAVPQSTLFQTTRMVHCFGLGHLLGEPQSWRLVDHGVDYLWSRHRDAEHGGYFWANAATEPLDDSKQLYGHAFVLLAASTAHVAGHPDARRLLDDVSNVIETRFWEDQAGAAAEEFERDWTPMGRYRGANGNMHFVEALLAAAEATGDSRYLDRAVRVAELIIQRSTAANDGRIPEHYRADWSIDHDYDRDVFRPFGSTIGHWLEWSRLLLQLWQATGSTHAWMPDAARALFAKAGVEGWDETRGGFYFTVDWNGAPRDRDRYWWPVTEGIAAAHWLGELFGAEHYEEEYRRYWGWSAQHLVDGASWRHQLDDALAPISDPWFGRPDVYHSLQATLIPLLPARAGLAISIREGAMP
jgi:sulfoquinovose isomerase